MTPIRIFISSVQKEFASERAALRTFLTGDPLMRRFFVPFFFEDIPAADRRADHIYLNEVSGCDIFVGLFGLDYGYEDVQGISPTHREFDQATQTNKHRLIFIKSTGPAKRHPKMLALIRQAEGQLVRRSFASPSELIGNLYAALVQYLDDKELIRSGPFDASPCPKATLDDLDEERMRIFISRARKARNFPLPEEATPSELLTHLNLLDNGRIANAAVLLFGRQPQRFLLSSEVKCAHYHGVEVAKPIPSYQVYKGTVFDLVDQSVDFVLSKINRSVGTREGGPDAPVEYEIPRDAVAEAIVNAVAHRDYTSAGSVQVMLFADRLEIWNPGTLPPSLTLEKLRRTHGSVPGNPLMAEPLYLARYIERMGTGTGDMIRRCRKSGLAEPSFSVSDGFTATLWRKPGVPPHKVAHQVTHEVTHQVTHEVHKILLATNAEKTRGELQEALGLRDPVNFRKNYLLPALEAGLLEMTIPDKPQSNKQRYKLTGEGKRVVETLEKGKSDA